LKYIISGASGAIGYALIKKLELENNEITVLINPASKRNSIFKLFTSVELIECDLFSYSSVKIDQQYDVFIHMAWQGGGDRNNIAVNNSSAMMSVESVNLANRLGCKTYIGTGSQAEYGYQDKILDENTSCMPDTAFGAAKLSSFHFTQIRCDQLGMRHLWLRIGSIYGPFDRENTMLVSTIRKVRNNILPLFSSGNQYWDFLYSDDLAEAMIGLVKKECSGLYVIGEGSSFTLKHYLKILAKELNIDLRDSLAKDNTLDNSPQNNLRIDPKKLSSDILWTSSVDFNTGFKRLIKYCKENAPL